MPAPVNPADPSDLGRGPMVMGLSWTFAGLAMIAVSLRFIVRRTVKDGVTTDDWLMGAALICNMASQAFVSIGYRHGFGKHDASLSQDQMMNVLKWMWLATTPGLVVGILARISIAILLVRLFWIHTWLKWFVIVVTSLCTILGLVLLPCHYLQSRPVSGNWDPFVKARRWNPKAYIDIVFLTQALWAFTDLAFVLFPVIIIWRLNMPLRQRLGLIILMGMSVLTMILVILKTISLKEIADQQANPTATDVQYNATLAILWSLLEQAFVIIMGCVPPLRTLPRMGFARFISASMVRTFRQKRPSATSLEHGDNADHSSQEGFSNEREHSRWMNRPGPLSMSVDEEQEDSQQEMKGGLRAISLTM